MEKERIANRIKAQHFRRNGKLDPKEYMWHIPEHLRGTIKVGDVVAVDANDKILPVKVIAIFREDYGPDDPVYKRVRRTNLPQNEKMGVTNKDKREWEYSHK